MTSLKRVQLIITFFLSNIFVAKFENIFTSSRAIFFFGAREIFVLSPFRNKIITSFTSLSIPESAPLTSFATMMSQFFCAQFFRGVFFHVVCFRSETDENELSILLVA